MFLKATRFSFLAVKFNYASLFFHLTFRRIIQDMKVNLQILFRIFCKYSVVLLSCGIFHKNYVYWIQIQNNTSRNTMNYVTVATKYWKETVIKHPKSALILIYWNGSELYPCHLQMVTLYQNIFWKQVTDLLVPKWSSLVIYWLEVAKIMMSLFLNHNEISICSV